MEAILKIKVSRNIHLKHLVIAGSDLAALRCLAFLRQNRNEQPSEETHFLLTKDLSQDMIKHLKTSGYQLLSIEEAISVRLVAILTLFSSFSINSPYFLSFSKRLRCDQLIISLDGARNVGYFRSDFGAKSIEVVSFFVDAPDELLKAQLRNKKTDFTTVNSHAWTQAVAHYLETSRILSRSSSPAVLKRSDFLFLYRPGWESFGVSIEKQVLAISEVALSAGGISRVVVRGPREAGTESREQGIINFFREALPQEIEIESWTDLMKRSGIVHHQAHNPEFLCITGILGNPRRIFAYEGTFEISMATAGHFYESQFVRPESLECFTDLQYRFRTAIAEQAFWVHNVARGLSGSQNRLESLPNRSNFLRFAHKEFKAQLIKGTLLMWILAPQIRKRFEFESSQ